VLKRPHDPSFSDAVSAARRGNCRGHDAGVAVPAVGQEKAFRDRRRPSGRTGRRWTSSPRPTVSVSARPSCPPTRCPPMRRSTTAAARGTSGSRPLHPVSDLAGHRRGRLRSMTLELVRGQYRRAAVGRSGRQSRRLAIHLSPCSCHPSPAPRWARQRNFLAVAPAPGQPLPRPRGSQPRVITDREPGSSNSPRSGSARHSGRLGTFG
jgi:hypothetical protein